MSANGVFGDVALTTPAAILESLEPKTIYFLRWRGQHHPVRPSKLISSDAIDKYRVYYVGTKVGARLVSLSKFASQVFEYGFQYEYHASGNIKRAITTRADLGVLDETYDDVAAKDDDDDDDDDSDASDDNTDVNAGIPRHHLLNGFQHSSTSAGPTATHNGIASNGASDAQTVVQIRKRAAPKSAPPTVSRTRPRREGAGVHKLRAKLYVDPDL
eukprot:TRINITY_DN419_c0_g2_i1.p1 TRINITY_DN419_c0_g2~~TRINITY_DN419_c0_g2_i1.p1  ORF type:complete len:215 (-),score=53.33 TRINITY_DN419_c0_g2_i1:34-678(-)